MSDTDRLLVNNDNASSGTGSQQEKQPTYASVSTDSNDNNDEVIQPSQQESGDMALFTITAILSTAFSCK